MSSTGKKRPPLVADRRYATGSKSKPAPKKAAAGRRPAQRKPGPPRGFGGRILFAIRRIITWVLRLIWKITWRGGVVLCLIVGLCAVYFAATMPKVTKIGDGRARGSVTFLDRNNQVFAWRGDQYGGLISAASVSPHLKNAIIATEDRRFYGHFGISLRGVASAIRINLREGRGPLSGHGGSTITQQTAKLLCLGVPFDPTQWKSEAAYEADCREGSLWRKITEATYALGMEIKYTKDEILTIYMNRTFLGAGSRGFEAASQRYFGKTAAEVGAAQSAMLAGLLVAPSRFAPTNNLQRAQDRAAVIIGLMLDQGFLSADQAAQALAKPAVLSEAASARAGGYFADWVIKSGSFPGFDENTTADVLMYTTLDQRIQTAAEDAMAYIFESRVREDSTAEAAIVVMSADGSVRGMVGGRQTKVSGAFNRATQAQRQTGSTFKPFVYATALELGYQPWDTVVDEPVTYDIPGSGIWEPRNYTPEFAGRVTLTEAMARSLNIPAVKVSESVGRDLVRRIASDFGIFSDLAEGPALALGASESTLIEMTGAYAGILNGGSSVTPTGLRSLVIKDVDGDVGFDAGGGIGERVIDQDAARALVYMMHQVVETGTGQRAKLDGVEVAGKTGTTQAARDAWFIGFTADYVVGVWMGYDDNSPLTGVTGSGLPADIWRETMIRVQDGLPAKPLPMLRDIPQAPQQVTQAPAPTQPKPKDPVEGFLIDILKGILGGN